MLRDDVDGRRATLSQETMDAGLNLAVKDNDSRVPAGMAAQPIRSPAPRSRLTVARLARTGAEARLAAPPLGGLRVVDLSTWIGGAYCTKLLADGGAEVIKVESPEGDPLRRWSASGAAIPPETDGALFNFLAASKRSVVVDPDRRGRSRVAPCAARVGGHGRVVPRLAAGGHPSWRPLRSSGRIRT